MPKKKILAADKQLLAETKQMANAYLGFNKEGRALAMEFMASLNAIPAYRLQPEEIAVPQPRKTEEQPEVRAVEGVRSYAAPTVSVSAPRESLRRYFTQHYRDHGPDVLLRHDNKVWFIDIKTAHG